MKSYVAISNVTNLNDLEWPWRSFYLFSCWPDFNWHSASRGFSAIAKLLVLARSRTDTTRKHRRYMW